MKLPIDKWDIILHNAYPEYISWNEFLSNQAQLQNNLNHYKEGRRGVPRQGQALLQGIIICGCCGSHMKVRYSGPHGKYPIYGCNVPCEEHGCTPCQEIRALQLDAKVKLLVFEALAPDKIALALASLDQLEQEHALLRQQWQLRLQRTQYEAERARRQYDTVEPENRLVARSLERQWEDKLRAVEKVKLEYDIWQQQNRLNLSPADREEIIALGEDLPKVWNAPSTNDGDRKQILRLVIKEVIVDRNREQGKVWFRINWQTGATSEHKYARNVLSYAEHADFERLQQRIRELWGEQKLDDDIADILNQEGFCTSRGRPFTMRNVWTLRTQLGLPTPKNSGPIPDRWEDGAYSVEGAAKVVGVTPGTIFKWLKRGQIQGKQLAKGTAWKVFLADGQIANLKDYVQRVRRVKKKVS